MAIFEPINFSNWLMAYNWQLKDWPQFRFDNTQLRELLVLFTQRTGRLSGLFEGLSAQEKSKINVEMMVFEAIKTSEIEGEFLSREDVMSSIKRNLGLENSTKHIKDLSAKGVAELMTVVRSTSQKPLSETELFEWHKMLFIANTKINVGQLRFHNEPMQVISGSIGKEQVHFEAPPSNQMAFEMRRFIEWFNSPEFDGIESAPVKSAIAHLYFESIHPFEDGNGRIGRAVAEKALFKGLGAIALISLSRAIESDKKSYYDALKKAQRTLEITDWVKYFLETLILAVNSAEDDIQFTLKKTRFFDQKRALLSARQIEVIDRMLKEGPQGFVGGMSAKKYIAITKASKATATRDLQDLVQLGVFIPFGSGRSARYDIILD
jgi:Fic family protein